MTKPADKPTQDKLAEWLTTIHQLPELRAGAWALFLEGLPWRYIKPVVRITVDSHQPHPKPVLLAAAKASSDRAFKAAATRHMRRQEVAR